MEKFDTVWKTAELSKKYLEGIRGAIPLAQEQIDTMLRLIRMSEPGTAPKFLDLGCGDGILGQAILDYYPESFGIFLDFSQPMLQAAQERLKGYKRVGFVDTDYGMKGWNDRDWGFRNSENHSANVESFDIIVSGYSIHHQSDNRKRELYEELFGLLKPGGIFLNTEHVASGSVWSEHAFEDYFIESLYWYHQKTGSPKPWDELSREFYNRPDKVANKLALVEDQCEWLREIGFVNVDCFLKIFELALFGGMKPS